MKKLTTTLIMIILCVLSLTLVGCGDKCTGTHTYGDWEITTPATCGDNGLSTRTCQVCGETETQSIPATGTHSYGDWSTTTEPTCITAGSKTRTCVNCNQTQTESIPATGTHTYGDWEITTPATCGDNGLSTRVCTSCGDAQTQNIPATGTHSYGSWNVTAPATCVSEGTKARTCSVCAKVETDTIPPTGTHVYANGICTGCNAVKPLTWIQVINSYSDKTMFIGAHDIPPVPNYEDYVEAKEMGITAFSPVMTVLILTSLSCARQLV